MMHARICYVQQDVPPTKEVVILQSKAHYVFLKQWSVQEPSQFNIHKQCTSQQL